MNTPASTAPNVMALVYKVVRWYPGKWPRGEAEPYVLALALDVSPRWGKWDVTIEPLAGGGLFKVAAHRIELHDQQDVTAALAVIQHIETTFTALKGTNG